MLLLKKTPASAVVYFTTLLMFTNHFWHLNGLKLLTYYINFISPIKAAMDRQKTDTKVAKKANKEANQRCDIPQCDIAQY